jgi:hypothetical protein
MYTVSRAIGPGRLAVVTVDAADMEVFDHFLCRAIKADAIPILDPAARRS